MEYLDLFHPYEWGQKLKAVMTLENIPEFWAHLAPFKVFPWGPTMKTKFHIGASKNNKGAPRRMFYNGKPLDDLGVPLFSETSI